MLTAVLPNGTSRRLKTTLWHWKSSRDWPLNPNNINNSRNSISTVCQQSTPHLWHWSYSPHFVDEETEAQSVGASLCSPKWEKPRPAPSMQNLVTTPTKQEHNGVRASGGQRHPHQDHQPGRSLRTDKLGLQGRVRDMGGRGGSNGSRRKSRAGVCLGCPRPVIRGWPEQKVSVTQWHHKGDAFWGMHWTYLPKISCQEMAWETSSPALDEGVCTSLHCSVTKSCLTLWDPMDCRMPGFPVCHSPGACSNACPLGQWCHPTFSSCHPLLLLPSILPRIRVFFNELALPISWQSIGASASAWVLPKNIQGWLPLGLTGLISLQFLTAYSSLQLSSLQLLSRNSQVFSSTTVLKPIISLKNLFFLRNSKPFLQVLIPHREHWTRLLFSHCAKHILLG